MAAQEISRYDFALDSENVVSGEARSVLDLADAGAGKAFVPAVGFVWLLTGGVAWIASLRSGDVSAGVGSRRGACVVASDTAGVLMASPAEASVFSAMLEFGLDLLRA